MKWGVKYGLDGIIKILKVSRWGVIHLCIEFIHILYLDIMYHTLVSGCSKHTSMPVTSMLLEMPPAHKNIFVSRNAAANTGTHKPSLATETTPEIGSP
jgi:hypothetical protein